ncbi:MAG: TIGR03016 family PEP-CTERM system-associated outer membrane protein [Woeseiaceae bacterium]|nr:TIGR03016 family PEP-CTERM system-associated outer membrane protein [Woeseiaceae bacterium]
MDKKTIRNLGYLTTVALACSLTGPSALAAQWEWELGGELSVIYTDNLRLEEAPFEDSDTVYLIRPLFGLSTDGDRVDVDIDYAPEAFYYRDASDSDEVFHILDAVMTTDVIRDALFFDLRATHYQTMVSPDVVFQVGNLPATGNRVDSTVLTARPYWQQDLGFARIFAEVSYEDSRFDEPPETPDDFNQDNVVKAGRLNLDNFSQQEGFAWGLGYSYLRAEYELAVPYDYQTATLNLGYWVNDSTRIFVEGGLESAFDNPLDPALEDERWEAGFQYAPNSRLNVEIAAGDRTFGSSVRADISYQLRRGNLTLNYSESPATRAEVGRNRRPLADTDNLDTVLDRPGEADRYIARVGELATEIELAKSEMSLRIFFEDRDQRTNEIGTALGDERFGGAAFRWSWRLGSKSTVGFDVDVVRREEFRESILTESDVNRFSVDYNYALSERLSLEVFAVQSKEESEDNTERNYTENQVGLTLRADFQ